MRADSGEGLIGAISSWIWRVIRAALAEYSNIIGYDKGHDQHTDQMGR
jgi:hypothetical protein